jgi:uncharacterized protein (DUF58 family)
VKEFEADTNTNFLIVLDASPSMHYRGPAENPSAVSKLRYGAFLAAALAYFSSTQRDRVGLAVIDGTITEYVPPSAKHLQQVLFALDRVSRVPAPAVPTPRSSGAEGTSRARPAGGTPAAGETDAAHGAATLHDPLKKLAESARRRSIIAVISDLYEEPEAVMSAVTQLYGRGNDIAVFHLLDRHEIDFPFTEAGNFVDVESGVRMPIIPNYLRDEYRKIVRAHSAAIERRARDQRVDYKLFDTSKPLDSALFAYLATRERLGRVR